MSYFDSASLVMIPSGYKTSKVYSVKPTDGSGDLTFSRSNDTATRVDPDGLIEKVRTNLVVQSNTFNVTWDNIGTTETSGQAGYDGTNNAWSLIEDSSTGNHLTRSFPSVTGLSTISIYAKAGTRNWLYLRGVQSSTNVIGWFNLSTGAVGTVQTNGTGKIESVGNGWYRCSLTVANFQAGFEIYVGLSNADAVTSYTGNGTGNILIQSAQVETGDIATDYIPTTSAAVSVGPVANVPRLDYLNSSCPRLLLEPQRTNKITYSENQGPTGTNWYPSTTWTVTNNTVTSPSGYQDAGTLTETTSNGFHSGYFNAAIDNAYTGTYTISAFAKYNGRLFVLSPKGATERTFFNLQNGTVALLGGGGVTAKIEDYGNGWYRCSVTCSFSNENVNFEHLLALSTSALVYTGDGTSGVHIWGCQAEAGAYATSYIPTLGAAVTRGADACSKTGISSLIGQTEGTIFFECSNKALLVNGRYFCVSDGTGSNRIDIYQASATNLGIFVGAGGAAQVNVTNVALPASGAFKFALAYANNDYVWYVNGTQVATDTSASVPATSAALLGVAADLTASAGNAPFSQALLFKTRLTNAQLAELTTI